MYVGSSGVAGAEAMRLWDKVTLTPLEEQVISSLAIIYPGLVRISFLPAPTSRTRVPWVKLSSLDQPAPLKTLGDGVSRIFGIALALVNAKDGLLLIDEVENGIHNSVHSLLWQFLIDAAERLNVQVFATTHSSDAIRAFQWAVKAHRADGVLTKLEENRAGISASQFDEADLDIAIHEAIEVR
jgi:predicted ATPase